MKKIAILLVIFVASLSFSQTSRPTVYIEPQQGFETYIAAAIAKKGVPVDVVTEKSKAIYILRSAPVEVKSESTGGKIARCLFAYCAGIEDKGNVSVQLIEVGSTKMVWAYSVNKQRGGSKNQKRRQQEPTVDGGSGCQTLQGIPSKCSPCFCGRCCPSSVSDTCYRCGRS